MLGDDTRNEGTAAPSASSVAVSPVFFADGH